MRFRLELGGRIAAGTSSSSEETARPLSQGRLLVSQAAPPLWRRLASRLTFNRWTGAKPAGLVRRRLTSPVNASWGRGAAPG